jgi:hypothetical protein
MSPFRQATISLVFALSLIVSFGGVPASASMTNDNPQPSSSSGLTGLPVTTPNDQGTITWDGEQLSYVPITQALTAVPGRVNLLQGTLPPTGGSASVGTSHNWTGYVGAAHTYTDSDVSYTEPALSETSSKSNRYGSAWAGIGTGTSSNDEMAQNGSEFDSSSSGEHQYYWYQVYPYLADQVQISGLPIAGGDRLGAQVEFKDTIGSGKFQVTFYWANFTDGKYSSLVVTSNGYLGKDADAIVERTTENGRLPLLSKFGTIPFNYVRFTTGGAADCVQANANTRYDMYDSSNNLLASSSYDDPNGCTFTSTRSNND